ncbi:hypothetical protein GF337_14885 [candidate division KSB1 bacterium]|nr:hypothetical protein [candidate division KSB1 bacterium]
MKIQTVLSIIIILLNIYITPSNAQQIDTTRITRIKELESQIDSLRTTINAMVKELQQIKQNMAGGKSDVDELIALLNNEDVETVSVESRSRRKRVDALLKAITQRPGQLRFNGGATTTIQHGSGTNSRRHTTGVGSFDFYAHTAFGANTLLFFDLEAIGGNGPDDFFLTFSGLNGDAGSTQDEDGIDRLNVLEAWVEFSFLKKIFTITAGKIDLTNYFDNNASANDETMQFISGAFVNNSAFAVPGNAPGLRLRTTLLNRFHFQLGLSNVHNSAKDLLKEVYKIASIGFTLFPGSEFEANFRFFGYQHPLADDATGWGISFDKVTFGAYNIFARYGQNDAKMAGYWGVQSSWSAGTRFVEQIAGQSTALGLAYGENTPSLENLKTEQIVEIYARRQLNQWTHISPHLQLVWNGKGASNPLMIFGVRTHFNF